MERAPYSQSNVSVLIVATSPHLGLTTRFWKWYCARFIDLKTEVRFDEMWASTVEW